MKFIATDTDGEVCLYSSKPEFNVLPKEPGKWQVTVGAGLYLYTVPEKTEEEALASLQRVDDVTPLVKQYL